MHLVSIIFNYSFQAVHKPFAWVENAHRTQCRITWSLTQLCVQAVLTKACSWLHSHPRGRSTFFLRVHRSKDFCSIHCSQILRMEEYLKKLLRVWSTRIITGLGALEWRHRLLAFPEPRPWIRWSSSAVDPPNCYSRISLESDTHSWPKGNLSHSKQPELFQSLLVIFVSSPHNNLCKSVISKRATNKAKSLIFWSFGPCVVFTER